jgi:hypothetical protein
MQTYLTSKQLIRWDGKQPNGMQHWNCDCKVDYVKLDPGAMELYEVHFCGQKERTRSK